MSMFTDDLSVVIGAAKNGNTSLKFPFFLNDSTINRDLNILDLSPRAWNALRRSGIETIGQLVEQFGSLRQLRNVGDKSIKEIRNKTVAFLYESMSVNDRKAFWREFIKLNNIEGISA